MIEVFALKLWYDAPAAETSYLNKECTLLPIGNGYMGALVSGQVLSERLQFNEESLWTGGPGGKCKDGMSGVGSLYNFGHSRDHKSPPSPAEFLAAMKNGSYTDDMMRDMMGTADGYGAYQNFGYLCMDHQHTGDVCDYKRELDLETAVASTSYRADNIGFKREYFASYPARIIAVRISADKPGAVDIKLAVQSAQEGAQISYCQKAGAACIDINGVLADNAMKYAARFIAVGNSGKMTVYDDKVHFENADSVMIVFSAATDYKNEFLGLDSSIYRCNTDPGSIAATKVDKAVKTGYDKLLAEHIEDHQTLFGRVCLCIGGGSDAPVDTLLDRYGSSPQNDRTLEELLFQYGRYMLIASSRPGTLPANLQGKWNPENEPPWSSDYHYNINLQMNYWHSGITNLHECALPLVDFIKEIVPSGEITARMYNGVKSGWTLHTSGNIFGLTAPGWGLEWGWSPANNAFICQNLWDYYEFSNDTETLRNKIYPIIKGAALFWVNALVKDGKNLIAVPSLSPEHGPVTYATAYDQQLIWELFNFTIRAIDLLELTEDNELRSELDKMIKSLAPVQIGTFGQIAEWRDQPTDYDDIYDKEHRHVSQLVGLHPGTLINKETPGLLDAARVTLERRGDGATGWSMGWKINFWARLFDGNHAYRLVQNLFRENIADNLFGLHIMGAPRNSGFQIDANMGYTAGVAEMLLQSHAGYIEPLPALPDVWHTGSIKGLVARGGFIIDMSWSDGKLDTMEITSTTGLPCTVRYGDVTKMFDTEKGKKYSI